MTKEAKTRDQGDCPELWAKTFCVHIRDSTLDYTCGTSMLSIWGKGRPSSGNVAIMWLKSPIGKFVRIHIALIILLLQFCQITQLFWSEKVHNLPARSDASSKENIHD
jgi:hypothetical protein